MNKPYKCLVYFHSKKEDVNGTATIYAMATDHQDADLVARSIFSKHPVLGKNDEIDRVAIRELKKMPAQYAHIKQRGPASGS